MSSTGVVAVLLAAGSSRRFGGEKLLAPLRGRPLWRHALEALAATPGLDEVLVVVRPGFPVGALPPRCRAVENPEHAEGMGASLRAGVAAAPAGARGYLVALADMPGIGAATVAAVLEGWRRSGRPIAVPVHAGRRGHPVVIGAAFRGALLACGGDAGARGILAAHPDAVAEIAIADPAVLLDVDEPADLAEPGAAGGAAG